MQPTMGYMAIRSEINAVTAHIIAMEATLQQERRKLQQLQDKLDYIEKARREEDREQPEHIEQLTFTGSPGRLDRLVEAVLRQASRPLPPKEIYKLAQGSEPEVKYSSLYTALRTGVKRGDYEKYGTLYSLKRVR